MRAVLQRVTHAAVTADGDKIAEIGSGLCILLGVAKGDTAEDAEWLAKKSAELRIFSNDQEKFDRSLLDVEGEALVVSQFTLLADASKGRRPNFIAAAPSQEAALLVKAFADALRELGVPVKTGHFGAHMSVDIENDGPVTIVLDTKQDA